MPDPVAAFDEPAPGGPRRVADVLFSEGGGLNGSSPTKPPRAGKDFVLSIGSSMKSLLENILISGVEIASEFFEGSSTVVGLRIFRLSLLLSLEFCSAAPVKDIDMEKSNSFEYR